MANTYKNIVITPNRSTAANVVPSIQFSGGDATTNTDINLKVYTTSNGTLSFDGSAGQLFSITNDLSGVIFSVNDISGIPSIEVDANGRVSLAQFSGNVGIGTASPTFKLDVSGDMRVTGNVILGDASTDTITLNGSVITLGNNQSFDGGTLFIDAVNNEVGIGITNPTSNLHVIGTANITGSLLVLGSNVTQAFISGNAYATAVGTAGNTYTLAAFNQANTALTTAQAAFAQANTGGSSSSFTSNVVISVADNTNAALRITQTGTGEAIRVEDSSNPDATSFVVDANGDVKISTTVPGKLAFSSADAGKTLLYAASPGSSWYFDFNGTGTSYLGSNTFIIRDGKASGEYARIDTSGNVLIGRTTSTVGQNVKLDVNGGINASILLASTNVSIGNANPQSTFVIDRPGGSNPNFVMQGDGEQTFRFLNSNTTVGAPTRVSWKLANRYNTDWQYIWYTDVANNGANDIVLQARTGAVTKTLFYGNVETGIVGIGRTTSTVGQNVLLDIAGAVNASAVLVNGTPLTSGGASVYSANVGNNSANTFTINHALNKNFVVPAVRENATGYYAYPDIRFVDANNIVLEFIDPPTTNAYVVIVLG
jgi:hypothetical protein